MINLPLPEDEPCRRKPSINLAKELLNWVPEIDINKGLCKTIKYMEKIDD